jgi:hypothetical protein
VPDHTQLPAMSPGNAEALPGDADMTLDDTGALAALVRHRGWWPTVVLGAWHGAVAVVVLVLVQMCRAPSRFCYRVRGHGTGASVAPMHRCGWPPAVAIALWWRRCGATASIVLVVALVCRFDIACFCVTSGHPLVGKGGRGRS